MRRDSTGGLQTSKALNTLLQSAGAVVMKKSCEILWKSCEEAGLRAYKVLDMHDEGQAEVHPDDIEKYIELAVDSIVKAGEYFKLNIPLAADAKVGLNMAETH
jgi:DNA polymerase I-like protein with 3'-5' exonuclease and polymerase domains